MSRLTQTLPSTETSEFSRGRREANAGPARAGAGFECVLCQSGASAEVGPNPDFPGSRISRCRRCGLIATSPLPSDAQLEDLYRRQYRQVRSEAPDRSYLRDQDARAEAQLAFVQRYGDADLRQARVLDVGCSAGSFLNTCSRWTGSLAGFEPDDVMRRAAAGRLPKTARLEKTIFRRDRLRGRTFDLIAASHVLEHVPQPVSFISSLCALLSDSGVLIVEVPNEDLLTVGNMVAACQRGLMHLFFFTPDTLRSAIETAGGHVVWLASFGGPKAAHASAANRATTFKSRLRKLVEGSSDPSVMEGLYRLRSLPKAPRRRRLMAVERGLDGEYLRVLIRPADKRLYDKRPETSAS